MTPGSVTDSLIRFHILMIKIYTIKNIITTAIFHKKHGDFKSFRFIHSH